ASRADGRFALVSITDTGIGIPQDEIGHVFERFRRVRSGAAQSIPGTGLGLTIVKQIVEMHGGKIWVESAVGHGSSFHFTIPLASADSMSSDRERFLAAGADNVLSKPFRLADLISIVENLAKAAST